MSEVMDKHDTSPAARKCEPKTVVIKIVHGHAVPAHAHARRLDTIKWVTADNCDYYLRFLGPIFIPVHGGQSDEFPVPSQAPVNYVFSYEISADRNITAAATMRSASNPDIVIDP